MKKTLWLMALLLSGSMQIMYAGEPGDTMTMNDVLTLTRNDSIMKTFHYRTGKVMIGKNLATVDVPPGCLFLDPAESRILMEDIFGNMPNKETLGILLSDTPDMFTGCAWLVELTYNDDGHVDDDDAKDINYDDLLKEIREQTDAASIERVKQGYESVRMIGWAKKPFYDAIHKKLHWAKELSFGGSEYHTLNYNIRVLGREGYLEMNIISEMSRLSTVDKDIGKILQSTNFIKGSQYADFNSDTDKLAEYGIGGLILGGILVKTGFFAKIGIFLLKIIKPLIIGIIALFAFIGKKLFRKKEAKTDEVMPE
jgi:uncharacterized membrane-anchored protein